MGQSWPYTRTKKQQMLMGVVESTSMTIVLSSLSLFVLLVVIKFLHKVWWIPIQIQRAMRSQGINGPSYRFLHGNTKEILKMRKQSMSKPMDLTHHILPRLQPQFYTWINLYGKTFLYWYGSRAHLVVTEPEFAKEVLNNRRKTYPKMDNEGFVKKLFGNGILTIPDGEKWAKLRKLSNHAFHAENLKSMTSSMIASVEMMLKRWKEQEGKEIEVFQEFKLLTSEVISRTAFGSSYIKGKDIFEMLMKLCEIISRNAFKVRFPGLRHFLKSEDDIESEKLEGGIRDSIVSIIKEREMTSNAEAHGYGDDFLGLLIKESHEVDKSNVITVQDVVDECKTFYVAGHETTSSLLSWTIFLLAIHTDWQEKARKEVLGVFDHQLPNSDGIPKLKTINMIINETLRLYPPVISFQRKAKEKVKLGKFIIPANMNLTISTLALHHDTQLWGEDAHLFKPERFSQGVAKATNNNPSMFIPFGLGPRSCVGLNFAANEAKISLSMILQRYAFTLSPTYIHSPAVLLTLRPQHGVQVILHAI